MPVKILDIKNNAREIILNINKGAYSKYKKQIIIYTAAWCGYCKTFKPTLGVFLDILENDIKYKHEKLLIILASDETSPPLTNFKPPITYPTISYYKNGVYQIDFDNQTERNLTNLNKFVENILKDGVKPAKKKTKKKAKKKAKKKKAKKRTEKEERKKKNSKSKKEKAKIKREKGKTKKKRSRGEKKRSNR